MLPLSGRCKGCGAEVEGGGGIQGSFTQLLIRQAVVGRVKTHRDSITQANAACFRQRIMDDTDPAAGFQFFCGEVPTL